MDSKGFIDNIEERLVPISPIIEFAISKQLAEIGATKDDLDGRQAMMFIENMTEALELFLGKTEARKKRKDMMSLLRQYDPEYFEKRSLI
ncbi:MAG: hypothetical protein KAJ33_07730 [Thermoplasmata archaeon]|nr:hypothetical protein [Thermoplasmata archaeon]MCK5398121.1 hypothetical protein [Thermoplasmata archaeon]